MMSKQKLPLKSVAGALLFSVLLGPVGLLYASTFGGSILLFLMFSLATSAFYRSFIILWLVGCVWSVIAVNRYNKKILLS
jgi:ABC-type multidrug transport system permease subunit